ncbi:unnamed protein product [Phyllotreta striolata]|uniref:Ninjurin-1 n=1 Tax=Phyllotreta striolata TaxID=444603 RepID=A0A9N9TH69_PHYSR|nr:unnamed protein product [Phyllotreta striolata]
MSVQSVSYSALSQGQGDNHSNAVNPSGTAPMATTESTELNPENDFAHPQEEKGAHHNHLAVDDYEGHVKLGDFGELEVPHAPHSTNGLSYDPEMRSVFNETIPDVNVYQHKKTLAQGMMDLALFSANANQLRYVLDSSSRHPYYWPSVICICLSLGLQTAIGIGLIWNALYNVKDEKEICIANKINNWCVIGIFLVVVVNVFVSSFGIPNSPALPPPPPVLPSPVQELPTGLL